MSATDLPLWASIPASILLVAGGLLTLTGSLGLLRLRSFYERMHAPSLGNTLGSGCVLIASMVVASATAQRPIVHEILIAVFLVMTSPVTAMMLMQAALYRSSVHASRGEDG